MPAISAAAGSAQPVSLTQVNSDATASGPVKSELTHVQNIAGSLAPIPPQPADLVRKKNLDILSRQVAIVQNHVNALKNSPASATQAESLREANDHLENCRKSFIALLTGSGQYPVI